MPLHEYHCECGHSFDDLKRFGSEVCKSQCPKCGKLARKIYTTPVVRPDISPHYNEQLGLYIGSRADEKKAIKAIYERTQGKTNIDWH